MPVAVVALAAGSFAAGATAFAAATTLAATVAAGAVMVGSAMTIVGTVTGNQKLTKMGAIVSVVGGIGGWAANAMSAGAEAAGAAGTAGEAAAGAAEGAAESAAAGAAESAAGTLPVAAPGGIEALGDTVASTAADTAGKAASSSGGMLSAATENAAAEGVAGGNDLLAQSLKDSTSTFNPNAIAGQPVANSFDAAATEVGKSAQFDAFAPQDLLHPVKTSNGMLGAIEGSSGGAGSITGAAGSSGWLGDVNAWAKANPELAKMALSGIGTAAGNLVPSSKDKAMMEAYKAQATATTAQTAALNRKALWGSGRIA